jgi:alpha-tubulin suppressor-like RCC1 family protein
VNGGVSVKGGTVGPATTRESSVTARRRRGLAYRVVLGTAGALAVVMAVPAGASAVLRPRWAAGSAGGRGGTLRAWGNDEGGELGDGGTTDSDIPVKVKLPTGVKVTSVRNGGEFGLALTSTGQVLAWGFGGEGQLGNGTHGTSLTPVRVRLPAGTKVTAIRAGFETGLALTSAGQVLAWGFGGDGELGNGADHNSDVPVKVKLPVGTKAKAISAGCDHNLALTSRGQVLTWGDNVFGQLGNGTTNNSNHPVKVKLPHRAKAVGASAGCDHNLAMTAAGQVYAWGLNHDGELGDGTTTNSDLPVRIKLSLAGRPIGRVVSLFGGCFHSLALTSRGAVLAWGQNDFGQLGNATTTSSDTAVRVKLPPGTKVTAISAGCTHSLALTATGHVLAWGQNNFGQLGDGSTTNSDIPVEARLAAGLTATAIGAGPDAFASFAVVSQRR